MTTRRQALFIRIASASVLLLGLVLGGCSPATEVHLGAVLPLTGAAAAYGQDIKKGMDLELETINAAGGVTDLPLKITIEDSASDPAKGAQAAQKLLKLKVPAIIGGATSSVTLAAAPHTEAKKVILLSPAASSPDITGAGIYVFRIYPSDVVEGTMMAEFALVKAQIKKLMVIAVNNEYGRGLKTVFNKRFRAMPNREIVDVVNFDQGQTEWASTIAEIRSKEPDGIYLVGYPEETLSFMKALRSENIATPVLASRSFNNAMLLDPATEGVIFPRDPFDPERTDRAREFAAAYRQKYGVEANIWAANGADAVRILADAIETVGADPEKMRKWLTQVQSWDGACGVLSFDSNGDVEKRPVISIVHEGKFIGMKEYEELQG